MKRKNSGFSQHTPVDAFDENELSQSYREPFHEPYNVSANDQNETRNSHKTGICKVSPWYEYARDASDAPNGLFHNCNRDRGSDKCSHYLKTCHLTNERTTFHITFVIITHLCSAKYVLTEKIDES